MANPLPQLISFQRSAAAALLSSPASISSTFPSSRSSSRAVSYHDDKHNNIPGLCVSIHDSRTIPYITNPTILPAFLNLLFSEIVFLKCLYSF
ncbi:hypothetical protein BD410DRAFT_792511 [Rickenella mellea]|uniref:Uncharacterized protein n=1 Tax=Rickenella mellea TaxID=50990 RepID=A0A4Y7PVM0_9AGAM|nr:hypothetical protein BD410DRAFT_792511 [Rickenella mellea]